VSDFLGKEFPHDHDSELMEIQSAVLACIRPLTSVWQELLETDLDSIDRSPSSHSEGSALHDTTVYLSHRQCI
jgi:hypothetical protein